MSECGFNVTTKLNLEDGLVESYIDTPYGRIIHGIIRTQDEQIKQALIALGWTPPPITRTSGDEETK